MKLKQVIMKKMNQTLNLRIRPIALLAKGSSKGEMSRE